MGSFQPAGGRCWLVFAGWEISGGVVSGRGQCDANRRGCDVEKDDYSSDDYSAGSTMGFSRRFR